MERRESWYPLVADDERSRGRVPKGVRDLGEVRHEGRLHLEILEKQSIRIE
jgi:hypothetical protein